MDAIRSVKALLTLCAFSLVATQTLAATTDLDFDTIPDHEDEEVFITTNALLPAGEYTFRELIVSSSSVVTLAGDPNAIGDFKGVKIIADSITIEGGSVLTANGKGYTSLETSPGAGDSNGGYGYGGEGGDWSYKTNSALGGGTYGSAFEPKDLGSGGATNAGGGGAIWLEVSGALKNEGTISADGARQQASGGSVYVRVGSLEGSGEFTANGAWCAGWPYSGAGGGGRIAVYYGASTFTGGTEASRGGSDTNSNCRGARAGQDGTVVFIDTTNDNLYLYDRLLFQASDSPYEFNQIVLSGSSSVSSEPDVSITASQVTIENGSSFDTSGVHSFTTGNLLIDNHSVFTAAEAQSLAISSLDVRNGGLAQLGRGETLSILETVRVESGSQITSSPMNILHLEARDITVDNTSSISATGAGHPPRQGPGYNDSTAGASHGGLGERGTPSPVYGSETEPTDFGSGGSTDAYGGGSIRIIVSGTLQNNGTISADATPAKNGASGGSVYVTANKLSGSGAFTAIGGNTRGYVTDIGAGGGGRVAVYYTESDFVGTTSAKGGDRYVGGASQNWYYAQNGTVVFLQEAPKGISNILFLPGIQASRLYTNESGSEERVWEPFGDDDVELLRMTESGESIYDVYTRDVVDELPTGSDIYKGFLSYLEGLDGELAPKVQPFPYDWRQDVFDIVENGTKYESGLFKKPVETIEYLATLSPTRKATIIAHSNGGLLAKAIMLKLAEEGKTSLVDKVIFIASPHIGTPKGIAALLHGYDQEYLGGFVSSDEKVRSVMKNMPGVYGLLPSESYVDSLTEPMISFDDSSITEPYRDAYGFTISNIDEYVRFLKGTEGRGDAGDIVHEPSTANTSMLDSALALHREKLDTWAAPAGVEAYNIVGTGLPTAKLIEYREFKVTECNADRSVCIPTSKIEPRLFQTRYGDETVISRSAAFLEGDIYINLFQKGGSVHANITESETTQKIIDHILHGSSTDAIEFVTNTEPTFNTEELDVLELHSPAHMYVRDSEGNITGKTAFGGNPQEEIPGSSYFEFGGGKYLLVPKGLDYSIVIEGEDDGFYTHIASTLAGDTQTELHAFTATVTPEMVVTYEKTEAGFGTISVDNDGDGEVDTEMTLEGEIINRAATHEDFTSTVKALGLPQQHERHTLEFVENTEIFFAQRVERPQSEHVEEVMLKKLQKSFGQFKKRGLITSEQYEAVMKIIQKLIEQ